MGGVSNLRSCKWQTLITADICISIAAHNISCKWQTLITADICISSIAAHNISCKWQTLITADICISIAAHNISCKWQTLITADICISIAAHNIAISVLTCMLCSNLFIYYSWHLYKHSCTQYRYIRFNLHALFKSLSMFLKIFIVADIAGKNKMVCKNV